MATLVGGCNSAVDFSSRASRVDQSLPCMSVSMLYWSTVVGSSRGVQAVNAPVMVRGTNLRSRERYFFRWVLCWQGISPWRYSLDAFDCFRTVLFFTSVKHTSCSFSTPPARTETNACRPLR